MHWKGHSITSVIFLPKMHNLNPIMRTHQRNPNWDTIFYKINHLYLHECQVYERQGQNEETKEITKCHMRSKIGSRPPFFFFFNLFIYFWLCWAFVSVRGLSLVAASGGHSSSRCAGISLSRPLLLWSTGSRRAGSVVVAHGLSCSAACGILPDQGSNPCPLHWQADS